ncbi:hypothetical protein [Nocardioides sp.]|uniref:hypothetical protein n=1 Tax=Nocardioides sp. TaxID=35761 RepID=UPI00378370B9
MTDETPADTWGRWYTVATTFVAPATFVGAVLFYFGYVSARSQYAYFGVDVDTTGLSTRDYVTRSPQALLVPALLLLVVGTATAALLAGVRSGRLGPRAVRLLVYGGAVLGGIGLVAVLLYPWAGRWTAYALVTPLLVTAGAGLLAVVGRARGFPPSVTVMLALVAALATFWATATLAQWTGRGVAMRTARHLGDLPAVVLDTREPLYLGDTVTTQKTLPQPPPDQESEGHPFRYRYYGLRLLIQAGDLMFLVPERWDPSDSTVVVDMTEVRVRFRFVNQAP